MQLWLHAGSLFTSGTLNSTSWASNTNANRVSSSQTSFLDSTSRTFFITGVQLESGPEATPFEHRSFGDELARCQRYFCQIVNNTGAQHYLSVMQAYTTTNVFGQIANYPATMRTTPSVAQSGTFLYTQASSSSAGGSTTIANFAANSTGWWSGGWGGGSGLVAGYASVVNWANGAKLTADAEL